jgi:hypothetical protein
MTCALIVTIDTEEEGLWSDQFRPSGNTVKNVRGVTRFQQLCDSFAIRPTYLVDAPVVEDRQAAELLLEIERTGRCEIGAHMHPWCNPPLVELDGPQDSFLCNLPGTLKRDKLTWLTDAIAEKFGHNPTSFRAGRYALDDGVALILQELGYRADSSVIPFTDYSAEGGPNFEDSPTTPFVLGSEPDSIDADRTNRGQGVCEIPVSVGFSRTNFERCHSLRKLAQKPWLSNCRMVGILDRLNIARRIKFSPEQADARRMCQLASAFHRRRAPAVVMMLHSSSLAPGFSPYVRDADALERLYQDLEQTFAHCLDQLGMQSNTLTEFADQFTGDLQRQQVDDAAPSPISS